MSEFFKNIFIFNVILSICILPFLIYIMKNIDKYKSKKIKRIFTIILVLLLVPILFNKKIVFSNTQKANMLVEKPVIIQNIPITTQTEKIQREIVVRNNNAILIYRYAPYVWIVVSSIIFLYNILVYWILNIRINTHKYDIKNDSADFIWKKIKEDFGMKENVNLIYTQATKSPISIGFVKKKVVLPVETYDNEELGYILKHELLHIKHKDLYLKLLLLIVQSIYWFNPIIYLYSKLFNQIIEMDCDESVIENQPEEYRKKYLETLLNQIEKNQKDEFELSMNFLSRKEKVVSRFTNIINTDNKVSVVKVVTLFVMILILVFIVLVFIPNINFAKGNNEIIQGKSEDPILVEGEKEEQKEKQNIDLSNITLLEDEEMIGDYIYPVEGEFLISAEFTGENKHEGLDFAGINGDNIVAVKSGTVVFAKYEGSYGNLVVLDHGDGYRTYYAHCSKIEVNEGDFVSQGDVIAKIGSTGNSTGPHLHIEIRDEHNTPFDLSNFIK